MSIPVINNKPTILMEIAIIAANSIVKIALYFSGFIPSAEGMNPEKYNAIFTILLAAIIAISIKMVGLLLITGMLIIPAAMARNLSDNPNQMVIFSIIGGLLSVIIGLFASLEINTPSGPSIITSGLILFILSLTKIKKKSQLNN